MKLKEEDHGRMFPVSNKAQDVVDTLTQTIYDQGVEVIEETQVNQIEHHEDYFTLTLNNQAQVHSRTVIISTGGTSVPQTGSTGDGYRFAESLGHTITELFPTEVPIKSPEPFIKTNDLKA